MRTLLPWPLHDTAHIYLLTTLTFELPADIVFVGYLPTCRHLDPFHPACMYVLHPFPTRPKKKKKKKKVRVKPIPQSSHLFRVGHERDEALLPPPSPNHEHPTQPQLRQPGPLYTMNLIHGKSRILEHAVWGGGGGLDLQHIRD